MHVGLFDELPEETEHICLHALPTWKMNHVLEAFMLSLWACSANVCAQMLHMSPSRNVLGLGDICCLPPAGFAPLC